MPLAGAGKRETGDSEWADRPTAILNVSYAALQERERGTLLEPWNMGIGGSQVECRRKQNAREVEGAATVKDPEEEPLNESMDIQTTIYISCTDTFRIFAILTYI